ncbi:MAG TPA: hypothetical protein VGH97_09030 [Thermoanaerobaculia bacterium]
MRFLDARVHAVLDLVTLVLFLLGPLLFGLGGSPAAISYALAIVYLVLTFLTRFPIARRVPFFVHGIVELVVGVWLLILPSFAGYAPGSPARRFFLGMGAWILVLWALTAYGAREPRVSAEA